jgi:uncharacterized membrane protein
LLGQGCRRSAGHPRSFPTGRDHRHHKAGAGPFILLTLALSLQASYAAPMIPLAQNRKADRGRQDVERDRRATGRTQAGTEYLGGELAAIRLALGEMPTRDYLDEELERLRSELNKLWLRVEESSPAPGPSPV